MSARPLKAQGTDWLETRDAMTLHTCPHCHASFLYPDDLEGKTNCRLCGQAFELSAYTRAKPSAAVRAVQSLRAAGRRARSSPTTIYVMAAVATLVVLWVVLSVFSFIPDEIRLVNRRFVSLDTWCRVERAVGLVGVGIPSEHGQIAFISCGTAWAISNDGFMVASKHILPPFSLPLATPMGSVRMWVYINKRRIDAQLVWNDVVADIALLKVDSYLPYRFKVGRERRVKRLNVEVVAVGFQEMPTAVESKVIDTDLASTTGRISRVFQDDAGTYWLEHTAPLKAGSSGGPLLLGDTVVAINTGGEKGIYQALDATVYRDKIFKEMKGWRDRQKTDGEQVWDD